MRAFVVGAALCLSLVGCGGDMKRTLNAIDTLGYSEYQIAQKEKAKTAFKACESLTRPTDIVTCQNKIVAENTEATPARELAFLDREQIAIKMEKGQLSQEEGKLALKRTLLEYQQREYELEQAASLVRAANAPKQVIVKQEPQPYQVQPYIMPTRSSLRCTSMPMGGGMVSTNCN